MKSRYTWIYSLVHPAALFPLAWLVWDTLTNRLSINPIQDITHRTGYAAIVLLVLSLICTPANLLLGWKKVTALRKPLGLYAFLYVALHLSTFGVDYGFDWGLISQTIAEKRYVLVGFAAFLLLVPLALTSTKYAMKRLGKNWKRLHYLVYLIAPLAVFHYLWLSKDPRQPLLFGGIVAALLLLRLPLVKRTVATARSRFLPSAPARTRTQPRTEN